MAQCNAIGFGDSDRKEMEGIINQVGNPIVTFFPSHDITASVGKCGIL